MTKPNIRKRHLKLVFFGSSDEGDNESVASDKKQDIINLIQVLNEDETLAKVSIYTGGYGGTMNMIAGCFQEKLNNEIKKEIVGVVSEIYGTREDKDELQNDDPNKISRHNDRLIWTNSLQERTEILIESAPNIIVLPGKQGTLIEFLLADENARLTYNTNKTITKHFFLDVFWRDTLFQSHFIRKSYYENSKEKPKQHFFIGEDSDSWNNFIYDFDGQDIISYNDIHTSGDTDLKSLYTDISKKLEGLNNWKYCIEGLDFAYTIKTSNKIEESKFSNIGKKDYNHSTEQFLKDQSIIRSYIEDNIVSYCVYSNYKNDNTPIANELEFNEAKDIPLNALRNKKIRFEDWADYLRTKEIGSSTIFLFEKFETNSLVINSGYEMYYSLFVTLNVNVTPKIFDFIKNTLKEFLFRVSNSKSIEIFQRKEKSLRNTSLKSSLAAVMSRNMSHNIGSHVLNKLSSAAAINSFFSLQGNKRFVRAIETKDYESWLSESNKENEELALKDADFEFSETTLSKDEQSERTYVTFAPNEKNSSTFKPIYKLSPYFVDVNNNTTKEELARVFNDYLKKRMDFVADVATSNKALLNSNKYLFADIFRGFERNLLLLQNISGKEDKFSYQFDFQYEDENGIHQYGDKGFIDPVVAVPNDVLGSQAFYIILENIIRNTAKHSGSGNVIFTIKVEDLKEDDFYRVTVFDNVSFNAGEADIEKYKSKIEGYDKLNEEEQNKAIKANKLKKLVVDRNISIAQEVLDENNEIRTAGWGTIEIKLAACYLSGLDMLEMDNKSYCPIGYPRFEEKKEEIENELKDNKKFNKAKKEYSAKWESIEKYAEEKASEAYISFLTSKQGAQFTIKTEGLKTATQITDCPKELTRKMGEVTRYPIVQAVDGSKDETSGFGYSFLMKKPKKLLIIDENEVLKLQSQDEEANTISHNDNVIALKRLGIDIIETPNRDSIYNHQFMIIVGDGKIKEITKDEKGNKIIPYYGDWFNLPQERFWYSERSYKNFQFNASENKYDLMRAELKNQKQLKLLLRDTIELFTTSPETNQYYEDLNYVYKILNKTYQKKLISRQKKLYPMVLKPFTYDIPSDVNEKSYAYFKHHGIEIETFQNAQYAEIYGSVTALGLLADSIVSETISKQKLLKEEYKYFYTLAANTSVMVIDERIQSVLDDIGIKTESESNEDGFEIKYADIFEKTKIFVPDEKTHSVSLNDSNLLQQKDNLQTYIEKVSQRDKIDFLIIHFGIIEGLRGGISVGDVLKEIKGWIKSEYCKIVITSGRGFTPDIKDLNQYFVAYSTISNLLIDPNARSKGHLVKCLKQLRILNSDK